MSAEPSFLSEAYLEQLTSGQGTQPFGQLPKNITATLVLKLAGPKTNAVLELKGGEVTAATLGVVSKQAATLTLEADYDLAAGLFAGAADPAEQYMAGNLKVSGDMTLWLSVMSAWQAVARS